MASKRATTIRLDPEDLRALSRARKDGISSSELIRRGLRVAAAKYYDGRRPPTTGLFTSVDTKLGDESELFRDRAGPGDVPTSPERPRERPFRRGAIR